jgi:hypothetical protein
MFLYSIENRHNSSSCRSRSSVESNKTKRCEGGEERQAEEGGGERRRWGHAHTFVQTMSP